MHKVFCRIKILSRGLLAPDMLNNSCCQVKFTAWSRVDYNSVTVCLCDLHAAVLSCSRQPHALLALFCGHTQRGRHAAPTRRRDMEPPNPSDDERRHLGSARVRGARARAEQHDPGFVPHARFFCGRRLQQQLDRRTEEANFDARAGLYDQVEGGLRRAVCEALSGASPPIDDPAGGSRGSSKGSKTGRGALSLPRR